jgi:Leucine-rich repeat (LRR) protein
MPSYIVELTDATGEEIRDVWEARCRDQAHRELTQCGYTVLSLAMTNSVANGPIIEELLERLGWHRILRRRRSKRLVDLGGMQLEVLQDLPHPNCLEVLNLDVNQLVEVPAMIERCPRLQELHLADNELTALPLEIAALSNLVILDVSDNRLLTLPAKVGQLRDLQRLNLNHNQLTCLPPEIGELQTLRRLDLNFNRLTHLPPEIGELGNLRTLHLIANELTTLPREIAWLVHLESLAIAANKLVSLFDEIGWLTNLRELVLCGNEFKTLPSDIGWLTKVEELYLRFGELTSLPPEIGRMTNLRRLDLSENENFGLLGNAGLSNIEGLGRLEELCLNHTHVRDSDLLHLRELRNLRRLELAGTVVTSEGIEDLRAYRADLNVIVEPYRPFE